MNAMANHVSVQIGVVSSALASLGIPPLPPASLLAEVPYQLASTLDWSQNPSGSLGPIEIEPDPTVPPSGFAIACLPDAMGTVKIRYNPTAMASIDRKTAYFILLHEMGHQSAGHTTDPAMVPHLNQPSGIVLEAQADDSALFHLLKQPNVAVDVMQQVFTDMNTADPMNTPTEPGATHPSFSDRARRIHQVYIQAQAGLQAMIQIGNDESISAETAKNALLAMGHTEPWVSAQVAGAATAGHMVVPRPGGGVMSFDELAYALKQLDAFESHVGVQFQLHIQWAPGRSPTDLFAALNANGQWPAP